MEREEGLKFSLAGFFILLLVANVALITLAANASIHEKTFAITPESTAIGIKWILVILAGVVAVGIAMWAHRGLLESGVSPIDTTWVDLVLMAYVLFTAVVLLFLGETAWVFFGFFMALLFLFSAFVLRKLLGDPRRWLFWLVSAVVLMAVAAILILKLVG